GNAQARRLGLLPESLQRGQQSTGEYIIAYEIAASAIMLKQFVANEDGLDHGPPPRAQGPRDCPKVIFPVSLTHGLDHFDRHDHVKGAAHRTIILKANFCSAIDALAGELMLSG